MTTTPMPNTRKPTRRQLAYLRSLAQRTGQTFAYPRTMAQASVEISRLKRTRPSSRTERYIERKLIADQIATGPSDAARVREDEIHGRGSSATWVQNRPQGPRASSTPSSPTTSDSPPSSALRPPRFVSSRAICRPAHERRRPLVPAGARSPRRALRARRRDLTAVTRRRDPCRGGDHRRRRRPRPPPPTRTSKPQLIARTHHRRDDRRAPASRRRLHSSRRSRLHPRRPSAA
jgi:hypothetical protein